MKTVGATLKCAQKNALLRTAICLQWTEATSNNNCNHGLIICLRRLTVTCILKANPHRTYIVQSFYLFFFLQLIALGKACVREFRFTLCLRIYNFLL
jgi:hypothetical protein